MLELISGHFKLVMVSVFKFSVNIYNGIDMIE